MKGRPMIPLSEQEEDTLRRLLCDRADQASIANPIPTVTGRSETKQVAGRRTFLLVAAAVIAVIIGAPFLSTFTNWSTEPLSSADPDPTEELTESEVNRQLLVLVDDYAFPEPGDVIFAIESRGFSPRYPLVRHSTTNEDFERYWSPHLDLNVERVKPLAFRVEAPLDPDGRSTSRAEGELASLSGVLFVDHILPCSEAAANPYCYRQGDVLATDGFARLAIFLIIGTAVGAVLVRRRIIPGRVLLAAVVIAISLPAVRMVVDPVRTELNRVEPEMNTIRQQYGESLSCNDWYEMAGATNFQYSETNRNTQFDAVDITLLEFIDQGGNDIYGWYIWVLPVLLIVGLALSWAFLLPKSKAWKIAIRVAVVFTALAIVASFPSLADLANASALDCFQN